jgi:hypothetical protein
MSGSCFQCSASGARWVRGGKSREPSFSESQINAIILFTIYQYDEILLCVFIIIDYYTVLRWSKTSCLKVRHSAANSYHISFSALPSSLTKSSQARSCQLRAA